MALSYIDFSAQTVGSPPTGVTKVNMPGGTCNVISDSGTRYMRVAPGSYERFSGVTFDSPGSATDCEIVAKLRYPTIVDQYKAGAGVVVRAGFFSPYMDGYAAALCFDFGGGNFAISNRGVALVASGAPGGWWSSGTIKYWIRARVSGTTLKAWVWVDGGTVLTNADTPTITITDATVASGLFGIFVDTDVSAAVDVEAVGFATAAGEDAPIAPTGGGGGGGSVYPKFYRNTRQTRFTPGRGK